MFAQRDKMTANHRATKQWQKARTPYGYYQTHIRSKSEKHTLTVVDLLFVTNFKGGSATIAEPEKELSEKLAMYSEQLKYILLKCGDRTLGDLNVEDLKDLIQLANAFLKLTKDSKTKIDGFGPSFASALLNAHLPKIIPILDRRGLNGASIPNVKTNSAGQVVDIEEHYGDLIRHIHARLKKNSTETIESIDKELFSSELDNKYKPKDKRANQSVDGTR